VKGSIRGLRTRPFTEIRRTDSVDPPHPSITDAEVRLALDEKYFDAPGSRPGNRNDLLRVE